jgi:hypothetical protein
MTLRSNLRQMERSVRNFLIVYINIKKKCVGKILPENDLFLFALAAQPLNMMASGQEHAKAEYFKPNIRGLGMRVEKF